MILIEYTNMMDRQADRQTPHYSIGCAIHSGAAKVVFSRRLNVSMSTTDGLLHSPSVLPCRRTFKTITTAVLT